MEAITSFLDNIKQKVTNPFFGTFIMIWFIRNWELVYTIFNFDEGTSLAVKKSYIINYIKSRDWTIELFNNIWISILVMLSGYILIVGTRVLVNVIEFRIMPNLNKRTVSKLVTNTEVFNEVIKERDDIAEKYEREKEKSRKLVNLFDSQKASYEEVLSNKDSVITSEKKEKEDIKKKNIILIEEINLKKAELEKYNISIQKLESNSKESIEKEKQVRLALTNFSIENRKLQEKSHTIEQIFLTGFKDYEMLEDDMKKYVEKQIPITINLPYEELKAQNIDQQFFQIAEMLLKNDRLNHTSFSSELIEKFEVLGLVSIHGEAKNKSYNGNNIFLNELAMLVVKLKNILETKYSRRFGE